MMQNEGLTVLPPPEQVSRTASGALVRRSWRNGRSIEIRYESRCKVCNLPGRLLDDIHTEALNGAPATRIFAGLDLPPGCDVTARNVQDHLRVHLVGYKQFDQMIRSVSRGLGEIAPPTLVGTRHLVQAVIEKGAMLLANDDIDIKMSDVLAAARIAQEIDRLDESGGDARFYGEAMAILLSELRRQLPPREYARFVWTVRQNPRMAEISRLVGASQDVEDPPDFDEHEYVEIDGVYEDAEAEQPEGDVLETLLLSL